MNLRTATTGAFVVAFLAVGLPYWPLPYAQVSLPNSLSIVSLAVVFVLAAALCAATRATIRQACVVGAAVPAVIAARVIVEVARDPTSHNLWPFELVIGAVVGLAVAGGGALLGRVLARMIYRS